jgi:serine/threonine-protein kinase
VSADPPKLSRDVERLAAFGTPDGPTLEEAVGLFAQLRTTPHERRAIDRLLARGGQTPLPDALLVAVASALVDRGEEAVAARVLAGATSSPALMIRAELIARAGDRATALALVERILSRDIDWPGARERHERWRNALGVPPRPPRVAAWDTVALGAHQAPFELFREVGRGGAGAVYEARDRALGRSVALKIYHRPDRDRSQLLHEARVAVSLYGPGVVRVFDVDPEHGWLAMEWARSGALRSLLRAGNTSELKPIARWAIPLSRALARVHAAGWVHQDIKPANVLILAPAEPLMGDFGNARRIGEPSPPGSLGYVSPERLARRASDPRDDVYAFGRVLEDALDALGGAEPNAKWRALATACTGPDEGRPANGADLLARAAGAAKV